MSDVSTAPAATASRPRLFGGVRGGERKLVIAIAAIALIGVAVAGYLVYIHYAGIKPICAAGSGGCEKVQTSDYAKLAGIPVADLGLAGYIAILASLALSGFGFSLYLTYREIYTIKAICQWCVGSAVLMTVLAVLTTVRLIRADPGG